MVSSLLLAVCPWIYLSFIHSFIYFSIHLFTCIHHFILSTFIWHVFNHPLHSYFRGVFGRETQMALPWRKEDCSFWHQASKALCWITCRRLASSRPKGLCLFICCHCLTTSCYLFVLITCIFSFLVLYIPQKPRGSFGQICKCWWCFAYFLVSLCFSLIDAVHQTFYWQRVWQRQLYCWYE